MENLAHTQKLIDSYYSLLASWHSFFRNMSSEPLFYIQEVNYNFLQQINKLRLQCQIETKEYDESSINEEQLSTLNRLIVTLDELSILYQANLSEIVLLNFESASDFQIGGGIYINRSDNLFSQIYHISLSIKEWANNKTVNISDKSLVNSEVTLEFYLSDAGKKIYSNLLKEYSFSSPQRFSVMLFALNDFELLKFPPAKSNQTKLHKALVRSFGANVGVLRTLNININKLIAADLEKHADIEIERLIISRMLDNKDSRK